MTHFVRRKKSIRQVDLIPMVNIIFMLLFFFIIAGTVKNVEPVPVDIPNAESISSIKGNPTTLVLSRGGKLVFNGTTVKPKQLPKLLSSAIDADPNILITIRADEKLPAKSLTTLIAVVQKAGGSNLALEIETGK